MKLIQHFICVVILCLGVLACKKDNYKIGGSVHDPNVNMTTYDYLKSNPLFDTLVKLIDYAGMKNDINAQGNTLFACTNFSTTVFLDYKKEWKKQVDENMVFTLDSVRKYYTPKMMRDSLGIYLFPTKLTRDNLTSIGKFYNSITPNEKFWISLEEGADQAGGISAQLPKYIFFTKVIGAKDDKFGNDPTKQDSQKDKKERCQTTGIITTNGVVHVMPNTHSFTFYVFKK